MEIELARHNWAKLRSFGDSADLPDAIRALTGSADMDTAWSAYWRIDSVTIQDGCLTESTPAVVASIVQTLTRLSDPVLICALEVLTQVSGGYVHESAVEGLGPVTVADCVHEISLAFPFYCEVLEASMDDQIRSACIDLIAACGSFERNLTDRARFVLASVLDLPGFDGHRSLIVNSLADLDR